MFRRVVLLLVLLCRLVYRQAIATKKRMRRRVMRYTRLRSIFSDGVLCGRRNLCFKVRCPAEGLARYSLDNMFPVMRGPLTHLTKINSR